MARNKNNCFLWVKHKTIYIKGKGYVCKHCGKTKLACKTKERS